MTINWINPIQTRDGRKAELLRNDYNGIYSNSKRTQLCLLTDNKGFQNIINYPLDGYYFDDKQPSNNDIINKVVRAERYLNLYPADQYTYRNLDEAIAHAGNQRIGNIKITFENGIPVSLEMIKD